MTQKDRRLFLHDLLAELLGIPKGQLVWNNQLLPRRTKPFGTLDLYSQQAEAFEEERPTDESEIHNVRTPTTAVLEVQLYDKLGEFAADKIENMVMALERPSIVDRCFLAGVAFYDAEPIVDLTSFIDGGQTPEPRAAVDLHIRYTNIQQDNVGHVAQVNLNGKTDDTPLNFSVSEK